MMKTIRRIISRKDGEYLEPEKYTHVFEEGGFRENRVINIYLDCRYQKVLGFGAAFTETSAYNYSLLSREKKRQITEAYFDTEKGLGFNFCRTHIHSCDFSLGRYTYADENDKELKSFSIDRDRKYIIPFIREAGKKAENLMLFASPWTPPAWMKDNHEFCHGGRLLKEYYQTWADYIVRYVTEYGKEDIHFFGLTVQNEAAACQTWESCLYTAREEGEFVHGYLRPALDKAGYGDMKIMIWDHNRERVYDRAEGSFAVPGARDDIWGIGYHWYSGDHYASLDMVHEAFPEKRLILSESSLGAQRGERAPGPHSSWIGFEIWAEEMIENFNHHTSAIVAWNMLVDENGGPFHDRDSGCKAPVVVDPANDSLSIEPIYYAVAHFSKFVKRGAVRLGTSTFGESVKAVSFENPGGDICTVILNRSEKDRVICLRIGGEHVEMFLPAKSLSTCLIEEN